MDINNQSVNTSVPASTEPPYIKIYLSDDLDYSDMTRSLNPILIALCRRMCNANTGQHVFINDYTKKLIAAECKLGTKRVEQALRVFVEDGVLLRISRGVYTINPYIIGNGDWGDISSLRHKLFPNL